jgi:hypothetical protein
MRFSPTIGFPQIQLHMNIPEKLLWDCSRRTSLYDSSQQLVEETFVLEGILGVSSNDAVNACSGAR